MHVLSLLVVLLCRRCASEDPGMKWENAKKCDSQALLEAVQYFNVSGLFAFARTLCTCREPAAIPIASGRLPLDSTC